MKAFFSTLILSLLLSTTASGQHEILGTWKTIDDLSGKAKAVIEIYKDGANYAGRIIKVFREQGEDPDPICEKCSGADKGKKVIGLQIIRDMEYDDGEWSEGTILDAEEGKTYNCKLWIDDGKLKVRGYVAFFYRTQTWERYHS